MIKKLVLLLSLFFIFTFQAQAFHKHSMRKCMVLPVTDYVGGAIGFRVYEEVENYLRGSDWCFYKTNSEILNILGSYKSDLNNHLKNPNVLRILADKTKSGSLIRIDLDSVAKGVKVTLNVIGENGEDVYFRETTELNTQDAYVISQTVKNWLDSYEKSIPYDGRVLGVLGNQFTIDIGKGYGVEVNQDVEILRPVRRKRHPLLKEIVEWETKKIADTNIFYVSKSQSQGKVSSYVSKNKIQLYDWVKLTRRQKHRIEEEGKVEKAYYPDEGDSYKFGKLGTVGIFLNIGNGSAANSTNEANLKKIGGFNFGIDVKGELWATRNFWGAIEIGRGFASYKRKEGLLVNDSNSVGTTKFKIKAGYRYLPLGFFYGPQVDAYLGYARYGYGLDNQTVDGFGDVSFSGLLMGFKGSMPVIRDVRIYALLDFIFNTGYKESVTIHGTTDSASNYNIEFGGSYKYSPMMTIEGGIGFTSSKAKFESVEKTYSLKNTDFKIGTTFNF